MPESLQDKMARFAAMKKDKPVPEVKVFEMPNSSPPAPNRGKGYLDKLLDEVDKKYNNGVIR